jgi:hypothetical protein
MPKYMSLRPYLVIISSNLISQRLLDAETVGLAKA